MGNRNMGRTRGNRLEETFPQGATVDTGAESTAFRPSREERLVHRAQRLEDDERTDAQSALDREMMRSYQDGIRLRKEEEYVAAPKKVPSSPGRERSRSKLSQALLGLHAWLMGRL